MGKTYAFLVDAGPERATAIEVTTDRSAAADMADAWLGIEGENWALSFVPTGTEEGERVWLSKCVEVHDVPAFVAEYGEG